MKLNIHTQPDDETCGPTSLHAVYQFFNDKISLEEVVKQVEMVPTGGTLAGMLGCHALSRGYDADLYVYNVSFFDPSWFVPIPLSMPELADKLRKQIQFKDGKRFGQTSETYMHFIQMGGIIRFHQLSPQLLADIFAKKTPIITGLSATYLYQTPRELVKASSTVFDDIKGLPSGHFVVLCGQDMQKETVTVADPHRENPISHDNYYIVNTMRLINAIMLGVLTYDANLLVLKPKGKP